MGYNSEKNVQMLVYLLKAFNISKVIISPGATNIPLVGSLQNDDFFELFSAPDERSAAYIACGLAAESHEPVVISCTGATASRNYIPGLTEAFYRKLPVLAVTSSQPIGRVGQLVPQVIDRSVIQKDIAVMSVNLPIVTTAEDAKECNIKINTALIALFQRGGGPVHINLQTTYSRDFSLEILPECRTIKEIGFYDEMPQITGKNVAVYVGNHDRFSKELVESIEKFCERYNGCVIVDHTSNYYGKYKVHYELISNQFRLKREIRCVDLLIDIGNVSGSYVHLIPKTVWRVSLDGKVADRFGSLGLLFNLDELDFFDRYNRLNDGMKKDTSYYESCKRVYDMIHNNLPELPFSNAWIAQNSVSKLPSGCVLHLGILNTLRIWDYFEYDDSIETYCNTGGFGIDGIVSTFIGSCLATKRIHFCVLGDLAFFYDMNSLGNHHVPNNCRIMLINNGCGAEFKNYDHFASMFGDDANKYIAAMGHYGFKSPDLVKHYAEDLGFIYMSANDKTSYLENCDQFFSNTERSSPIVFEIFIDHRDESDALELIKKSAFNSHSFEVVDEEKPQQDTDIKAEGRMKNMVKGTMNALLGEERVTKIRDFGYRL